METLTPTRPKEGPVFTFDAVAHKYYLDAVEIPGVTTILKTAGLAEHHYGFGDAQLRGLHVHEACEYMDLNDLDWNSIYPAWLGYVKAYARFKDDTGFTPSLIEFQTYHPEFRFAGTIDRRGLLDGEPLTLDIKTGYPQDWHKWQLAGYQLLGRWPLLERRLDVYLKENGEYEKIWHEDPADFRVFMAALTITHAKGLT